MALSPERRDAIEDGAAGAVGVVLSVVAGPLGPIWSMAAGSAVQRRLQRDIQDIRQTLDELVKRGALKDLVIVSDSEEFAAGLVGALRAMASTADAAKRQCLRNVLINGAVLDPSAYSEYFMRLMRDYDIEHVLMVRWVSRLPPYREEDLPESGVWRDLEREAIERNVLGELSARHSKRVITRLADDGLLFRAAKLTYALFNGGNADRPDSISELGVDFVNALADPVTERSGSDATS